MKTIATLNTGKRCYCNSCGEYFSTTSNFDRHRKGDHEVKRYCVEPESVGLVIGRSGSNTFWRMPGEETSQTASENNSN